MNQGTLAHASARLVPGLLALILLVGGIVGTQIGVRFGMKLRGEQSRMLMSALILAVAVKLFFDLILTPGDLYGLEIVR